MKAFSESISSMASVSGFSNSFLKLWIAYSTPHFWPKKDFNDYQKLINGGLDQQSALKKLRIQSVPPTGFEIYSYLKNIWEQYSMITFKDFLQWYNNKDVFPTLEAMQKMIEFYHDKGIDMLKLGCTLPNVANICLHKSTNHKCYPFFEGDKDLCQKIREDMTGGPSIVFTNGLIVQTSLTVRNCLHMKPFSATTTFETSQHSRKRFQRLPKNC